MAYLTNLLSIVSAPTDLWNIILEWIGSWTGNAGWTIIIFTVMIKIVLLPLDLFNRYSTKKNTLIQKRLAPQVEKLNKKYSNDRNMQNQQMSALYKREGYNMIGSCVFMLVNLVLTLVIFFTIFSSLRTMSAYKMINQYQKCEQSYTSAISEGKSVDEANSIVVGTYETSKDSWLWIKNIWKNDTSGSIIPTYEDLSKIVKNANSKEYKLLFEETYTGEDKITAEKYNTVTASLTKEYTGWNGYYILAVLALLTSFVSQWISDRSNKVSKERQLSAADQPQDPTQNTMKYMKYIMPVIMVIFVLTNSAAFGLYIVASSIISTLLNLLINIFVTKMTAKEEKKYLQFLEKNVLNNTKKINKPIAVKRPKIEPGVKL